MATAGETKGPLMLVGLLGTVANSRCLVKVMGQAYSDNSPDYSSQRPSICGSETSFNTIHTIFPISDLLLEIFTRSCRLFLEQGSPATLHVSCTKWAITYWYGEIQPAALLSEERAKQVFGQHVLPELLYRSSACSPAEKRGLLKALHWRSFCDGGSLEVLP